MALVASAVTQMAMAEVEATLLAGMDAEALAVSKPNMEKLVGAICNAVVASILANAEVQTIVNVTGAMGASTGTGVGKIL